MKIKPIFVILLSLSLLVQPCHKPQKAANTSPKIVQRSNYDEKLSTFIELQPEISDDVYLIEWELYPRYHATKVFAVVYFRKNVKAGLPALEKISAKIGKRKLPNWFVFPESCVEEEDNTYLRINCDSYDIRELKHIFKVAPYWGGYCSFLKDDTAIFFIANQEEIFPKY